MKNLIWRWLEISLLLIIGWLIKKLDWKTDQKKMMESSVAWERGREQLTIHVFILPVIGCEWLMCLLIHITCASFDPFNRSVLKVVSTTFIFMEWLTVLSVRPIVSYWIFSDQRTTSAAVIVIWAFFLLSSFYYKSIQEQFCCAEPRSVPYCDHFSPVPLK